MNRIVKYFCAPYKQLRDTKVVAPKFSFIVITDCPWYKSFLGVKKIRLAISDGVTPVYKLRFI